MIVIKNSTRLRSQKKASDKYTMLRHFIGYRKGLTCTIHTYKLPVVILFQRNWDNSGKEVLWCNENRASMRNVVRMSG